MLPPGIRRTTDPCWFLVVLSGKIGDKSLAQLGVGAGCAEIILVESPTMSTLMESFGLDQLSTTERIILVEELWDSIAASPEGFSLSEAQKADLQRRLDAHRDNPKAGSPWEEVKARLQGSTR
jgi:putative addiction module component (TIGR02574 family)